MSEREEKLEAEEKDREGEEEEEDDDDDNDDDISSSGDSGSEDDMSESGDGSKATAAGSGSGSSSGSAAAPASASASGARGSSAEQAARSGKERSVSNQPFDEAVDLSESESSVAEDSPKKRPGASASAAPIRNQPFDEALELSGSVQEIESPPKAVAQAAQAAASSKSVGGDAVAASGGAAKATTPTVGAEIKNQPHDEEVDLSDSDASVDTDGHPSPDRAAIKSRATAVPPKDERPPPKAEAARSSAAPSKESTPPASTSMPSGSAAGTSRGAAAAVPAAATRAPQQEQRQSEAKRGKHESESSAESSSEASGSDEDEDEEDEEDEDESEARTAAGGATAAGGVAGSSAASLAGAAGGSTQATMMASAGSYKESDYAHLKVSTDVRDLFQYIGRFKAQEIELETRLKCFIPEYMPAVGDMDAFLKIPRPDGEADHLGLKMLDEPSLSQSDATVLDLQLRSTSKKKHGDIVVRSIEQAEKSPKEIDRWIKSIADLHRTKPPPQVHYSKAMPDIEGLMQVWPEEFEELLARTPLPSASLDLALEQYARVICAILDIPVHKHVFESLHVLFTLYLEFRSNQHFMNYDDQLESAHLHAAQRADADAPPPFTARRAEVSTPDGLSARK